MKKLFLSFGLALLLSGAAQAKTPPEVLKPYKAYKIAIETGDNLAAQEQAYQAWKQAEKLIGKSKITGDLAYNYAATPPEQYSSKKTNKRIEKAFRRSIELSSFHGDMQADIEIQRYIKFIDFNLTNLEFKKGKFVPAASKADINKLERVIQKYQKEGSTYEAEMEAIKAQFYHLIHDDEMALKHAERSLQIFETVSDELPTIYPIVAKLFKGKSLDALDRKIPAALEYQDVMQNLEGRLEADHPFVNHAFSKWMWIRNDIERAGDLEKAEAAGLCECWPFENYKNKPFPLIRVPPVMPPRAVRSGHVIVKFDLDAQGVPLNITKVSASSEVFVKAALKSVESWRFIGLTDERVENLDPEDREGIVNTITFRLSDENGRLIPE